MQSIASAVQPTWAQSVAFILFGIGAITYAKHPEGSIEAQTSASVNAILRRVEKRKAARAGTTTDGADDLALAGVGAGTAGADGTGTGPGSNGATAEGSRPTTGSSA